MSDYKSSQIKSATLDFAATVTNNNTISCGDFITALRAGHQNAEKVEIRLLPPKDAPKGDQRWKPHNPYKTALEFVPTVQSVAQPSFKEALRNEARKDANGADEFGVYFVVNVGGTNAASIKVFVAAFVEWDDIPKEEQIKRIKAFPRKPSAMIEAARGYHVYWFLKPGCEREQWEKLQKALQAHFISDSLSNPDRLMRLPGFDHTKYDKTTDSIIRTNVPVLHLDEECRYTAEELLAAIPETGVNGESLIPNVIGGYKPNIKWQAEETGTVREGSGRNNYIASVVGKIRRYEDFSEEAAFAAAMRVNEEKCDPPLDDDEVLSVVRSIFKKPAEESIEEEEITLDTFGGGLDDIEEYQDVEPNYIVFGLERGELGAIFAATNVGKSTLARNIAVALACGRDYLSPLVAPDNKPARTMILNFEGGRRRFYREMSKMIDALDDYERELVRENLRFVLHDDPKHRYQGQALNLKIAEHRAFVTELIKRNRAELVIVDTITTAIPFRNENANEEWQEYTKWLEAMAIETEAAIIFVHHEGKRSEGDGSASAPKAHRGRGGSANAQLAQLVLNLENRTQAGGEYVVLGFGKLKDEPQPDLSIQHSADRWFVESGILPQSPNDQYKQMLDALPADGTAITREELAEKAGLSYEQVKRFVRRAKNEKPPKLIERGKGKLCRVKEQEPPAQV